MKIDYIKQSHFSDVVAENYDVYISASGFETRAPFQAQQYQGIANRKLVLSFKKETEDEVRKENDSIFTALGFTSLFMDSEDVDSRIFNQLVIEIIQNNLDRASINIYVDYSSMTKNWYAYLLYSIKNAPINKPVNITFGYSHGKYIENSGKNSLNRVIKPLTGYCNLSVPSKPTALVICLGNEPNRILGLTEYFDAVPYLFYTDSSFNSGFSNEIERTNQDLINSSPPENVIKFPIYDLMYTNYILEDLCKALLKDFRIIIAPCGPKPFALLSMINSLKFEDSIEVWRISPGDGLSKIDRIPNGLVSVLQINLIPNSNS